jgi:glucosamine--fructose-6-phosphate aminotransferase (isomerizing)
MPPSLFNSEIMDQPAALQRLIDASTGAAGRERWSALPEAGAAPLLVGMGASYHSALLGAHFLAQRGVAATAHEAAELLYGADPALELATALVYISQSGASGEIAPILERPPAGTPVIALTNDADSPLAQRADFVLPLLAGDEQTVATKTYLNTLALLWLLAARWSGARDAESALSAARERVAALLAEAETTARRWVAQLGPAKTLVFLGAGAQAVTARQCAMMVMEWVKVPALSATLGAFRHGPLEIAEAGLGAVLFAAPGPAYASTLRLAEELDGHGVTVLLVEHGQTRALGEPPTNGALLDAALAPLLDVVPVQLFVEALARERGLPGTFRRIGKIVTHV